MLFGFKDRRTAEKLKRIAARDDGTSSPSPHQLPARVRNRTLFLGKTTVVHETGETEDVDIYAEDETDLEFTLPAKNTFRTMGADQWVLIGKPGDTWLLIPLSCPAENGQQRLTVIGQPTGATLELDVTVPDAGGTPVTEEVVLNYDDDATEVEAAFETDHSEIDDGDVIITGGPLPNVPIEIEFAGKFAYTEIPLIRPKYGNLTGGSGTGAFAQFIQTGRS